ncbi:hypothetical protein J8281_11370 [Aquimarina sp. U1-2]|uniref:hypothetical protein n=1 Tax=Aquimarina sp. U1-2 TaxID=2823141 RepID=UPI001AEC9CC8|nr:hypothetical protein [Aquimarina sp. U1-2]MBP2832787.1 hypothetical protein [Aquimarina sp. U1-2]
MKKSIFSMLLAGALVTSCNIEDDTDINSQTVETTSQIETTQGKSIIVDGQIYHAGFGMDPAGYRPFNIAISDANLIQSSAVGSPATDIELEVIETNQELSRFIKKSSETSAGLELKIFELGGSKKKAIEQKFTFNKNHISVIAKIKVKRFRNLVTGTPAMRPEAQTFIDNKDFNRFLSAYGALYIDDRITGAEIYYVYNYNYTKQTMLSKSSFKRAAKFSIGKIFGFDSDGSATSQEEKIIEQTMIKSGIVSDLVGYAPNTISKPDDVNREINRIQDYLRSNPELAGDIETKLKPYSSFINSSELKKAAEKITDCFKNKEDWEFVRDFIIHVKNNTNSNKIKKLAVSNLATVNQYINKSINCSANIPYDISVISQLKLLRQQEVASAKLYRYYSRKNADHYYTTDFSKYGNGNNTWKLEGVQCIIFKNKIPGTVPLHRYYHAGRSDNFYPIYYNEIGDGSTYGFVYKGIYGYVYKSDHNQGIPFYRKRHSRTKDFFFTTSKTEGAPDYAIKAINGRVLPTDYFN